MVWKKILCNIKLSNFGPFEHILDKKLFSQGDNVEKNTVFSNLSGYSWIVLIFSRDYTWTVPVTVVRKMFEK